MPLEPILAAIEKLRTPQVSMPVPMQQMLARLVQLLEQMLRSGMTRRSGGAGGGGTGGGGGAGGGAPPASTPVATSGAGGSAPPSPYSGHSAHGSRGYPHASPQEMEAYERAVAQYREQYRQAHEQRKEKTPSPSDTMRGRPVTIPKK